jgi:hypothetical protein
MLKMLFSTVLNATDMLATLTGILPNVTVKSPALELALKFSITSWMAVPPVSGPLVTSTLLSRTIGGTRYWKLLVTEYAWPCAFGVTTIGIVIDPVVSEENTGVRICRTVNWSFDSLSVTYCPLTGRYSPCPLHPDPKHTLTSEADEMMGKFAMDSTTTVFPVG